MNEFEGNNRQSIDQLNQENDEKREAEEQEDLPPIKDNEFALVSNPVFRRLFVFVRFLGVLISLASLITELAYLTTHRFSSLTYWICYLATCGLKFFLSFFILLCQYKRNVIGKKPKSFIYELDEQARQEKTKQFMK
jgi:hypothetical protein